METLTKYLAVAAGGAVGACLRYYLGGSVLSRMGVPFPSATFFINITGSFIVGFFLTLVTERFHVDQHIRLAVAVGFVGAYTTFSTFEYETARLIEAKDYLLAFLNVVLSFTIGFGAVWGGMTLARKFEGVPLTSHVRYEQFESQADERDPAQSTSAERDIRDASINAAASEEDETRTIKRT